MQQFKKLMVVVFLHFYSLNAANLGVVPTEDTTDSIVDMYDPSSDETFDPQKDYADFKSSYEKLYQISGSPYVIPSMQQKSWPSYQAASGDVNIDTEESTNPSDITQDANDLSTTVPPQIDQQTTMKFSPENAAIRTMNDIVKSTQRPIAYPPYQPYETDGELLKRKPSPTFDSYSDIKTEDDLINDTGNSVRPVVFAQNESNLHNESADYVNDEAIDTNYSQSITSIPYAMDTTITSLPSSPVFISTRPPTHLFSSNTPASTVSAATAAATDEIVPNQSIGKKSKKIEALPPRIYKYSADEIVRKYLDDTFLRAPLATLINTAPEPLRKAKILWKSALRPNTPVDIVLVAFNSSGKQFEQKIKIIICDIIAYNKPQTIPECQSTGKIEATNAINKIDMKNVGAKITSTFACEEPIFKCGTFRFVQTNVEIEGPPPDY